MGRDPDAWPSAGRKRQWTLHNDVQGWVCENACMTPRDGRRGPACFRHAVRKPGRTGADGLLDVVILELEWPTTLHGGLGACMKAQAKPVWVCDKPLVDAAAHPQ